MFINQFYVIRISLREKGLVRNSILSFERLINLNPWKTIKLDLIQSQK